MTGAQLNVVNVQANKDINKVLWRTSFNPYSYFTILKFLQKQTMPYSAQKKQKGKNLPISRMDKVKAK